MRTSSDGTTRREALRRGLAALAVGPSLVMMSRPLRAQVSALSIPPLGQPDANGVRLPAGFSSRILASAGIRVKRSWFSWTGYRWHIYPDGGATFPAPGGGWVYVSNSESLSFLGGGVGAIRFDARGNIQDAYRILGGTNINCAGGPTPWGTWLSCEEIPFGRVYECDPLGSRPAEVREALGFFQHEAAAVDPATGVIYLTEDEPDGRLYRFVPAAYVPGQTPDLSAGTLQVAEVQNGTGLVRWIDVPNPNPEWYETPTRRQVAASTAFDGGEGCWYANGAVYFTTKGDNRVWCLILSTQTLTILYDAATSTNPILTGVDNVTASASGKILVAEDGGDMQIVVIDANGNVAPLLQIVGQDDSEITGPAFSPNGERLYFSSQRGNILFGNGQGLGITYEVRGPFSSILA